MLPFRRVHPVQTQTQLDHLKSRFARDGHLIRNPIDTHARVEPSGNHPFVLWIGRADRDSKRADICLDIARKCPELTFVVVMNETDSNSVDEFCRDAPENVVLHRHVELSQVEQFFADAAVLINTSNSEGFPNTFLLFQPYFVSVGVVGTKRDDDSTKRREPRGRAARSRVQ